MALLLGNLILQDFECPAGLRFGGAQALAVHRLPGGARIIDAMGPDDADVTWRGFLSGPDACDRARQFDAMRISGAAASLAWNDFFLTVIVKSANFIFRSPWWIQYDIACTVFDDALIADTTASVTANALILNDIASAGAWTNVAAASSALAAPNAMLAGTQANAAASAAIGVNQTAIEGAIAAADSAMASTDVGSLTSAAGILATTAAASGFIGRAAANLANAGT